MKDKILRFLKKTKLKNIVILSSGVFVAQSIGIIIQPIATRLYTAEMFGKLALITSIVSIVSPILTFKYDQLIVVIDTEHEAITLTALSLLLGFIISSIVSIGVIVYNLVVPDTFREIGSWIYFSIPLIFLSAFDQVTTMYNNRYEQYKLMASVSVTRSVLSGILKILLGVFQCGFLGLIISSFMSTSAGIKRQSKYLIKNLSAIKQIRIAEILYAAKKYKDQPLFSAPGLFVNSYSYSVLPIFITAMYGVGDTGNFSQSMIMLGLPLSLISVSAGQVFLKNASKERAEQGGFYSSFKSTTLLLSMISILPFTVLWFCAEPLFSFLFGIEWFRSGTFVRLLIPMYFVRFTVTALTDALIITGKQKLKFLIQCIFVVEATIAYSIAKHYVLPIETFLTIINYSYMANYLVIFFMVLHESKPKKLIENVESV